VLGLRLVVEIAHPRERIEGDVLEYGAETIGGGVDLGLGFFREPDALGVAATLKIEHAVGTPAVLIVADQDTVGIGRERGLAGAGEAEEQRDVAVVPDI